MSSEDLVSVTPHPKIKGRFVAGVAFDISDGSPVNVRRRMATLLAGEVGRLEREADRLESYDKKPDESITARTKDVLAVLNEEPLALVEEPPKENEGADKA